MQTAKTVAGPDGPVSRDEVRDRAIEYLTQRAVCGYHGHDSPACEPTALAALALLAAKQHAAAARAVHWLQQAQTQAGSVGVRPGHDVPSWPTGLAVLAWQAALRLLPDPPRTIVASRDRAVAWILSTAGETSKRDELCGHDTTLAGWPWVTGTHSWLEPTALQVMALKAAGQAGHPRTREGIALLLDRQLPAGGCNMGNTTGIGQGLRPQLHTSGIALLALAGEPSTPRVRKSIHYVQKQLPLPGGALSISWGILGLCAHESDSAIEPAILQRRLERLPSPHAVALLLLATMRNDSPLIPLVQGAWA